MLAQPNHKSLGAMAEAVKPWFQFPPAMAGGQSKYDSDEVVNSDERPKAAGSYWIPARTRHLGVSGMMPIRHRISDAEMVSESRDQTEYDPAETVVKMQRNIKLAYMLAAYNSLWAGQHISVHPAGSCLPYAFQIRAGPGRRYA